MDILYKSVTRSYQWGCNNFDMTNRFTCTFKAVGYTSTVHILKYMAAILNRL